MTKTICALGLVLLTSCANSIFDDYSSRIDYCNYQGYYLQADSIETSLNDSLNANLQDLNMWTKDNGFKELYWHGHITLNLSFKQQTKLLKQVLK